MGDPKIIPKIGCDMVNTKSGVWGTHILGPCPATPLRRPLRRLQRQCFVGTWVSTSVERNTVKNHGLKWILWGKQAKEMGKNGGIESGTEEQKMVFFNHKKDGDPE